MINWAGDPQVETRQNPKLKTWDRQTNRYTDRQNVCWVCAEQKIIFGYYIFSNNDLNKKLLSYQCASIVKRKLLNCIFRALTYSYSAPKQS